MPKAALDSDLTGDSDDSPLSGSWPVYNGHPWDGKKVLKLCKEGVQPLKHCFDIRYLIKEIEEQLNCYVLDIPLVKRDEHFFNFSMTLYNRMEILARVSRVDVHDANDCTPARRRKTALDDTFEMALYDWLMEQDLGWIQKPIYYRGPLKIADMMTAPLRSIEGRRLFVFAQTGGEVLTEDQWMLLNETNKIYSLVRAAQVSASLYRINIDAPFADRWVLARTLGPTAEQLARPVSPTRGFCGALIAAKVNQLLGYPLANMDIQYRPSHVGEADFLTRRMLIRVLEYILPKDRGNTGTTGGKSEAYRFVLEHGQYHLDSLVIVKDQGGHPTIDGVRNWRSARIVPAILSKPQFVCAANLGIDREANPTTYGCRYACGKKIPRNPCVQWTKDYFEALFDELPNYQATLRSGKYARELWYALCNWKGEQRHHEAFFDSLRQWAEWILISRPESNWSFIQDAQRRRAITKGT